MELGDEGLRKSGRERRGQPRRGLEGRGGVCSGWGSTRLRAVLAGHAWCGGEGGESGRDPGLSEGWDLRGCGGTCPGAGEILSWGVGSRACRGQGRGGT